MNLPGRSLRQLVHERHGVRRLEVRETITGGTVIVGTERSQVQSGEVTRTGGPAIIVTGAIELVVEPNVFWTMAA